MRDKINVLINITPKYGELLQGVGAITLQHKEKIFDNDEAMEEIKEYLRGEAPKSRDLDGLSQCLKFQVLMRKYVEHFVKLMIADENDAGDRTVNILMHDFFYKSVWPVVIDTYFTKVLQSERYIPLALNVKRKVYVGIYETNNPEIFVDEFRKLLAYNRIILVEHRLNQNGDIRIDLIIPLPMYGSIEI